MRFGRVDYNVEWVLGLTEEDFVKKESGKFTQEQLRYIYNIIHGYGRTNVAKNEELRHTKRNSAKPVGHKRRLH